MARGSDKLYARILAGLGKGRVLAQKAVARVNGVHAALFRKGDYLVNGQIGPQRAQVLANQIRLVCLSAEEVHHVLFRVYRHRSQPEIVARTENAYSNLTAVRGHYLLERVKFLQ